MSAIIKHEHILVVKLLVLWILLSLLKVFHAYIIFIAFFFFRTKCLFSDIVYIKRC